MKKLVCYVNGAQDNKDVKVGDIFTEFEYPKCQGERQVLINIGEGMCILLVSAGDNTWSDETGHYWGTVELEEYETGSEDSIDEGYIGSEMVGFYRS